MDEEAKEKLYQAVIAIESGNPDREAAQAIIESFKPNKGEKTDDD